MVNSASLAINAINVALTLGLVFYTLRISKFFKGGAIGRTTPYFVGAAFFLFMAAVFRAALHWGYFTGEFEPFELTTRTIGFVLLFAFAYKYAQAWLKLGK